MDIILVDGISVVESKIQLILNRDPELPFSPHIMNYEARLESSVTPLHSILGTRLTRFSPLHVVRFKPKRRLK